jgi:arylsulfatase A-like enzyme
VKGGDGTSDEEKTRKALAFLGHIPRDKPFALFLNYEEPHDIYNYGGKTPPRPLPALESGIQLPDSYYKENFSSKPAAQTEYMNINPARHFLNADESIWKSYRGYYRQRVKHFDQQLGQILQALKEHQLEHNTLLIVSSDHGDMDSQHRLVYKGPFMYEQLTRVPLFIRTPKTLPHRPPGVDEGLTVNVDLLPTLLDYAGVREQGLDGRSLAPRLWGNDTGSRSFIISEYQNKQKWNHPIRMIRTNNYKFVDHRVGMDELYNLSDDPDELHNLACTPGSADILHELARELKAWQLKYQDPFDKQSATDPDGKLLTSTSYSVYTGRDAECNGD